MTGDCPSTKSAYPQMRTNAKRRLPVLWYRPKGSRRPSQSARAATRARIEPRNDKQMNQSRRSELSRGVRGQTSLLSQYHSKDQGLGRAAVFKVAADALGDPCPQLVVSVPTPVADLDQPRVADGPRPVDALALEILPVVESTRISIRVRWAKTDEDFDPVSGTQIELMKESFEIFVCRKVGESCPSPPFSLTDRQNLDVQVVAGSAVFGSVFESGDDAPRIPVIGNPWRPCFLTRGENPS